MSKLSLVIATNTTGNILRDFLSPQSLAEMAKMREAFPVEVLMAAQGDWATDPENQRVMRDLLSGVDVPLIIVNLPQENPVRMAFLRQSAAMLNPHAKYYMFVDDDLEFMPHSFKPSSGDKYIAAVAYMDENDKCGSLGQYGEFGSVAYGHDIRPDPHGKIAATAKGLILRNVFCGRIFPDEVLAMTGPFEEMAAILYLNLHGLYYAKQFKVPSKYKRGVTKVSDLHGPDDKGLHSLELGNANIRAWIRRTFNQPYYLYGDSIINHGFGIKPKGK